MTLTVATAAGLAIAVGGLVPVLCRGRRWPSTLLLAVAGGAVLGIVGVDALPAAWEEGSLFTASGGAAGGLALMAILHAILDPGHHRGGLCPVHGNDHWLQAGFLAWVAVVLHNVLDGFGIGAGFQESTHLGFSLAAAVAIHNLPVGMLVATPLVMGQATAARVVVTTLVAGMFTPLGAVLGQSLAGLSRTALATTVAMAGGSLLFILGELLGMSWGQSRGLTLLGAGAGVAAAILLHLAGGH